MAPETARIVDDLQEAVSLLELEDVRTYATIAVLRSGAVEGDYCPPASSEEDASRPLVRVRDSDELIEFRVRFEMSNEHAYLLQDMSCVYSKSEAFRFEQETQERFGTAVAMFTLFPYLREGLAAAAKRIGYDVTLGILLECQVSVIRHDVS